MASANIDQQTIDSTVQELETIYAGTGVTFVTERPAFGLYSTITIGTTNLFPGYLGLLQSDFNRAGENAFLVGLSYDFARVGLSGLSGFFNYAEGFDSKISGMDSGGDGGIRPDRSANGVDEREFNLTVDYRFQEGWLRGLWLRVRGSLLRSSIDGFDSEQVRVILNYDIPVL